MEKFGEPERATLFLMRVVGRAAVVPVSLCMTPWEKPTGCPGNPIGQTIVLWPHPVSREAGKRSLYFGCPCALLNLVFLLLMKKKIDWGMWNWQCLPQSATIY